MRLFKIEEFRNTEKIVNTIYRDIPSLIKDVLLNHRLKLRDDRGIGFDHSQFFLYCVIEQFKNLDKEDVSYLLAIVYVEDRAGSTVKLIGGYQKDYIHNMLCYCDHENFTTLFAPFFPEEFNENEV